MRKLQETTTFEAFPSHRVDAQKLPEQNKTEEEGIGGTAAFIKKVHQSVLQYALLYSV